MATVKLDPAKGVQIPNLTTTERNAISSPETGALIWNTTTSAINQYNGSAWSAVDTSTDNTKLPLAGGTITGNLGIGETSPDTLLHLTSNASSSQGIKIENTSGSTNGDAILQFTTPSISTTIGIDGTGTDVFKISNGTALGTNDVLTINSSGNVGIGTTSPTAPLHIQNSPGNNTTDSLYIYSTDGAAQLRMEGGGDEWIFNTNYNQNQLDIKNKSGSGSTNTRVSILSGGGISFNGDTAAANALDDYEEGTWTPTITFSSSAPNVTLGNINAGHYTKIGDTVHFHMTLHVNAYNSGSGNLIIGGLPFAHTSTYTKRFITASLSADHLNWESDWVAVNLTNATGGTTGFTYTAQRDNAASEYIAQANYPTGNTYHFATGHYYTDS